MDDMEYAGFWVRTGAALIDGVLIALVTIPILLGIYGESYFDPDSPFIQGSWDFVISYLAPAAATILFWNYYAATPGKMLIKARIVDARTGNKATNGQYVLRYLGYFAAMLPLMLGILWVAFDSKKQGWHDKIAGTVVIKAKNTGPEPVAFDT